MAANYTHYTNPYNLTALQDATTPVEVITVANDFSGGVLVGGLVIAVFFIGLLAMKKYDFEAGLAVSSFGTFLISGMLAYANLLNFIFPLIFLAITAFTGLYIYASRR